MQQRRMILLSNKAAVGFKVLDVGSRVGKDFFGESSRKRRILQRILSVVERVGKVSAANSMLIAGATLFKVNSATTPLAFFFIALPLAGEGSSYFVEGRREGKLKKGLGAVCVIYDAYTKAAPYITAASAIGILTLGTPAMSSYGALLLLQAGELQWENHRLSQEKKERPTVDRSQPRVIRQQQQEKQYEKLLAAGGEASNGKIRMDTKAGEELATLRDSFLFYRRFIADIASRDMDRIRFVVTHCQGEIKKLSAEAATLPVSADFNPFSTTVITDPKVLRENQEIVKQKEASIKLYKELLELAKAALEEDDDEDNQGRVRVHYRPDQYRIRGWDLDSRATLSNATLRLIRAETGDD